MTSIQWPAVKCRDPSLRSGGEASKNLATVIPRRILSNLQLAKAAPSELPLRCNMPIDHAPHLTPGGDRKSTRLNSSHVAISYAVFCLKKKTDQDYPRGHNDFLERRAGSREWL